MKIYIMTDIGRNAVEMGCLRNKVEFSVIIPVYNAKDYLVECIESVIKQTYTDFELIIIDDGSTDDSGEICDHFADIDERIKVIHQKNKGLISARKTGMDNANGEYVIFVDADDWIEKNELEIIARYLNDNNVDMIEFGFWKYYKDGLVDERVCDLKCGQYFRTDIWNAISHCIYNKPCFALPISYSLCCKAIKSDIIKDILHKIDMRITIGEDAVITFALLHEINDMLVIHESLYHYRVNCNSMIHGKKIDKNYSLFIEQLIKLHDFYQESNDIEYMNYISLQQACWQGGNNIIRNFIIPTIHDKKVVLFGKGVFSNNLQRVCNSEGIEINAIIDSEDVYRIRKLNFDIVFIAITISSVVDKAINILIENGVSKNKIKYITFDMLG